MGSRRLPGKALACVAGQPMLALILDRLLPSQYIDQLVVATTQLSQDQAIVDIANDMGVACFRGSEEDCLDRYYHAAAQFKADVVIRLTGDNPLIDAAFVDWVVRQYLIAEVHYDYVNTSLSKTFPVGLSVEVFPFDILSTIWQEDTNKRWREHVTPFIYEHPSRFRILNLASPQDYSFMRWTVDTPEDLEFVRAVYERLGPDDQFSWRDVLTLLDREPALRDINSHVRQKQAREG